MAMSFEPQASYLSYQHSSVMGPRRENLCDSLGFDSPQSSLHYCDDTCDLLRLPYIRACHARRLNSFGSSLSLDLVNRRLISNLAWKVYLDCFGFAFGGTCFQMDLTCATAMRSGCYVSVAITGLCEFSSSLGKLIKLDQSEVRFSLSTK